MHDRHVADKVAHRRGDLQDACRFRTDEVVDSIPRTGAKRRHDAVGKILDVNELPALLPVTPHAQRFASSSAGNKCRDDRRLTRTRAERYAETQIDDVETKELYVRVAEHLCGDLCCGVGMTGGREGRLLRGRFVAHPISIHPDRAAEDEAANTDLACSLEDNLSPIDVDIVSPNRIGHDDIDVGDRGQMNDRFAATQGSADRSTVKNVTDLGFDGISVIRRMHEIEDSRLVPRYKQPIDYMRANEARAPRYKNSHEAALFSDCLGAAAAGR